MVELYLKIEVKIGFNASAYR